MRIFNRLTDKFKFILKATLFLYLVFSFYEWNLNPGIWHISSRVGLVLAFGFIAAKEE